MSFTRRLVSGTTQLALSSGVMRLVAIATMPILTTLLSPQAYGVAALAGTVISLVSVIGLAGIEMSYARAYYSAQPPSGATVEHYCWRFAILGALLAAVFTAIAWSLFHTGSGSQDQGLPIVLALGIVLSVANTMSQTRANLAGRYRAMAMTSVATGIISAVASIGIAAIWRRDALALLLPMLLSYLIPVLLLGSPAIAKLAKPSTLAWQEGASLIRIGLAGVVTAPMYWLLTSSDRWFLQHYHGTDSVGIYSIGYSVAISGMIVNGAIMAVWLPAASREYEQDKESAKATLGRLMSRLTAAMGLIWLAVAAAGGDIVRWLADERFHDSASFVPWIAGGVLFYGVSQLALSGLVLAKQLKWAALWWVVGGMLSVLLNRMLVPDHGGFGAAIAQCASFAFISLGILATSQAKYPIRMDWVRLMIVMAIIFGAGLYLTPPWHGNPPFSILMKLPFGIAAAIIVFWIAAPDWFIRALERLGYRGRHSGRVR